jgi:hypothetical protein
MNKILGLVGRAAIIWVVPLVVSFLFYSPEQRLIVHYALFKSVMIVVLTLTTLAVNVIRPPQQVVAWQVALLYAIVNWVLDFIVLLPMSNMSFSTYWEQIGMTYIIIPVLTWALLSRPRASAVAVPA